MPEFSPSDHAPHLRRQFLLHFAAISAGLLLVLAVKIGVDTLRHRHLVSEAEQNIRQEIENNHRQIAADLQSIQADRRRMQANMNALRALRRDPNAKNVETSLLWSSSSPSDSAWKAARDTRAISFMSYNSIQSHEKLYGQQLLVKDEMDLLIHNQARALVSMGIEATFRDAAPSEIDEALHRCAEVSVQLDRLETLVRALDSSYQQALERR